MRDLIVTAQSWPVAGSFRIARSSLTQIDVVQVIITQGPHSGYGECRPYARYNETPASVIAQIEAISGNICAGLSIEDLQTAMPAGAARNALDCALWDLRAKCEGASVIDLLGAPKMTARKTAFTLSIDTPAQMAKAAMAASGFTLLKMKIKDMSGLEAARAVLAVRPDAELIIDANEALHPNDVATLQAGLAALPVIMIEQPIKAGLDAEMPIDPRALPILCADESLHKRADLARLWDCGYRAVNVKLDKCGGLTEANLLMREAKAMGFVIMAGCMVGTSLAMAPMLHLAHMADVIDLDGPALLSKDCKHGLIYACGTVGVPSPELWGGSGP